MKDVVSLPLDSTCVQLFSLQHFQQFAKEVIKSPFKDPAYGPDMHVCICTCMYVQVDAVAVLQIECT